MTKPNELFAPSIGILAVMGLTMFGSLSARAGEVNWNDYMHSAFSVAAIAAAMSRVEHCSKKPLLIEEIKEGDDKRRLVITCDGTEEEEGSSVIVYERIGDGPWMPERFGFAG